MVSLTGRRDGRATVCGAKCSSFPLGDADRYLKGGRATRAAAIRCCDVIWQH